MLDDFIDVKLEINIDPINNSKQASSGKTTTYPK